ncbi:hypothetical protein DU508_14930 [Pedobacter chinensis]|uniref:MurNAc-LAA domain-containing protein n=1 Tax=Pedobacter chinensis TaxID=2282421 RepID=A0A369PSQ6_9SPHI|nr:N-acetylmuramoyl-L-alanine amidase [Pedobacter chinensis]RDC55573.1 hypothetical protein DU508_14930 [Pedobacter chinensis]
MKILFSITTTAIAIFLISFSINPLKPKWVIVWQPSHQTDTGVDFSEAKTCNAIADAAMESKPKLKEFKVWSLGKPNLHHDNAGSNTVKAHTSDVVEGKISGYAYELEESNKKKPDVFIAIHNNGGTKRHAIWGFVHEGDAYEEENKLLAGRLIAAVSAATDLENRGVLLDSSTGRNDYVCKNTGKKSFYSLDENINTAKYRVLLEIGDNGVSKAFLEDPANQKKIGKAIKEELAKWLAEKK